MKKFLYSLSTDIKFSEPIQQHTFLLRATPLDEPRQEALRISLISQPIVNLSKGIDAYGNVTYLGYLEEPHSSFRFRSTGEILVDSTREQTHGAYPFFKKPTPLTSLSESLAQYFKESQQAGSIETKVWEWLERLKIDFKYQKGVTTVKTSASEAWEIGSGVCQDYAHILLALLRAEGIICRYIAGLIPGEGASHAWVEYFDGKRWLGVDPTHCVECNDNYVKLSQGLDFYTSPLEKGVFIGSASQTISSKAALIEV